MAERRMFAKTIIDSDLFLDMPLSAQALYFHLAMRADDDGFVNNPKKIQRMVAATDDDAKLLISKQFVIPFESGVVVVKHWKIHNYIQKDRYKPTLCTEEWSQLDIGDNGEYLLESASSNMDFLNDILDTECIPPLDLSDMPSVDTSCIQTVSELDTQVRKEVGKVRKGEKFTPPSEDDVRNYCEENSIEIDVAAFCDYYERQGWVLSNGNKMRSWKAAVKTWYRRDHRNQATTVSSMGAYQARNSDPGNWTEG
jgi:hypothetical protein